MDCLLWEMSVKKAISEGAILDTNIHQRYSIKKVFVKLSQNSQEDTK